MKVFVILSVLVAGAISARLDNTYIPPANAQSAGGYNLDTPKQAHASNVQNTYATAPANNRVQSQYQQQSYQQPGLNQGTFTSVHRGNGFQSVSAGAHSSNAGQGTYQQQQSYQAPQQNYQQQQSQQNYQQQSSYPAQPQYNNYQQNQQSGYASTTPIPILEYENEPHQGDGRYRFRYLTGNGIMAQEEGYLNNPQAQYPDYPEQVAVGSYSYTAPDGQQIALSYKADANGFQPVGDHLPTPPSLTPEFYEQVELQKKIAAEVEAEGQRILQLQAQLAQNQPQQNQYQQHGQGQGQQHGQQQNYNFNAQASNTVYQQQQAHSGYNQNAQPVASKPQQQYLPPQKYGRK